MVPSHHASFGWQFDECEVEILVVSHVWNRRCYCEGGELFSMGPSFQVALR